MVEYRINNFNDFHNVFEKYDHKGYASYATIYRGVRKLNYKLIPKLGRLSNKLSGVKNIDDYEKEIMNRFLILMAVLLTNLLAATTMQNNPVVTIETTEGTITIALRPDIAPKACENFIGLSKKGYYNCHHYTCTMP